MFVVAGVSGNTGSVVASTLLERGEKVRVVVRDRAKGDAWSARGAEVAVAPLTDVAALTKAFAGAKGAYVLIPPSTAPDVLAEGANVADAIVAAASAAKLPHVVLLSSIGAHLATGTGPIRALHRAESQLVASGIPFTAIRAGNFYENSLAVLGAAKSTGTFPTFYGEGVVVPSQGAKDIGRAAAQALLEGPRGVDIVELSGPVDLSPEDMARSLGKLLGKDLKVQRAPEEAIPAAMASHGMSPATAELYREMFHCVNAGTLAFEGGSARRVRGTYGIDEFFRDVLAKG